MVFLREAVRRWPRNLRLFSTQIETYMDPIKLRRKGGRAIPTMLVQNGDFLLNKWLSENKPIDSNDWITARKELMASTDFDIKESRVDMVIVHLCLSMRKIDKAMEYLQYLWDTNGEMNIAAMMYYLKCCYTRNDREINEVEKKYLFQIYDTIRKKYPILDSTVSENCITAISKTERWRESIEILETMKLSDWPRTAAYSAIISTAYDNNDSGIGWKYLKESLIRLNPENRVYTKYLEYCTRNFHGMELENEIEKMFQLWADNDVRPCIEVIDAYSKAFDELEWTSVKTSITGKGVCNSCRHHLCNLKLKDDEFATLAKTIRERVIVGADIYQRSNPKEYKKFLKYVDNNKPWDIVIDGLNMSYLVKGKADASLIVEAVKTFDNMKKKVLILGRKHMAKWPSFDIAYITKKADIFLAEDGSADDPFLLYAAFSSGPATMIVSRDFMRQHVFLVENTELKRIFKYWQIANQIFPLTIRLKLGKPHLLLNDPIKYVPMAQKHMNGWHVPYTLDEYTQRSLTLDPPKNWMCFKKTKTINNN